jgi:hypothetical protein
MVYLQNTRKASEISNLEYIRNRKDLRTQTVEIGIGFD